MTVYLINRTGRMKVFTLDHATYCEPHGVCHCGVDRRTGRRVARSLTLPATQRSSCLPVAVLEVRDILRAVAAGELGVKRAKAKRNGRNRRNRRKPEEAGTDSTARLQNEESR